MFRFKRKRSYIVGILALIVCVGIGWILHYVLEPIGTISGSSIWGSELKLNGITYISEMNASPIQAVFFHHIGRTQNGDTIATINGENPNDFVYIIGDMWEGMYRRKSLPEPKISVDDVSMVTSGTKTSKDPSLITDVVRDLNSSNASQVTNLMADTREHKQYGIDIRLKPYPGLRFLFSLESFGRHMYLEMNMQKNTFVNVDGTVLKEWILGSSK